MSSNMPIHGCDGCASTAGRWGCPWHGNTTLRNAEPFPQPAVLLRDTPEAVDELTDIIMAESAPLFRPEDRWVAGGLALRIIGRLRK